MKRFCDECHMKVGVLGGTFDPIHVGHLVTAEEVCDRFGLSQVLFVPAGKPPHKQERVISASLHRLAMVELAIAGNPRFRVSRIELEREGPSYTVDTLSILRQELGPETELYFIIGLDSLAELMTWYDPARLVQLARIVAVARPGYRGYDLSELEPTIPGATHRIEIVTLTQLDIASSEVRRRVAAGQSIAYQVPSTVERYIRNQQLYKH